MSDEKKQTEPKIRVVSEPESVLVYSCMAIVSPPNEHGVVVARAGNLAGVTGRGGNEREALRSLVAAFKAEISRVPKENLPWIEPPEKPGENELERLLAVHL